MRSPARIAFILLIAVAISSCTENAQVPTGIEASFSAHSAKSAKSKKSDKSKKSGKSGKSDKPDTCTPPSGTVADFAGTWVATTWLITATDGSGQSVDLTATTSITVVLLADGSWTVTFGSDTIVGQSYIPVPGVARLIEDDDNPNDTGDDFFYTLTCDTWTLDDPDELYQLEEGVDTPTAWHLVFERQ
jgi:ABC-type Fe3+-hydroxamate transport system substrate-binding protein